MGLFVIVVLLLVIAPGLLYLVGWAVKRYTKDHSEGSGGPIRRPERSNKPDGDA